MIEEGDFSTCEHAFYTVAVVWTPYSKRTGDDDHGWRRAVIAEVWVDLPALLDRPPDAPARTVVDGIDLDWRVRGRLTGWWRSSRNDWLAVVDYEVPYADGGGRKVELRDQLLPARLITLIKHWHADSV